jgi:formate/nitrite transporter FocA (FNT family)
MPQQTNSAKAGGNQDKSAGLTEQEIEHVEERSQLRAPVIYEVLRREGEQEMSRPITSLWWSGVAAGLSISVSLVAQAILQSHLPDTPWRILITALGYTTGFLIAVLARHQLFTENTITAVLPLAAGLSWTMLGKTARLWGVVLLANFVGTLVAALFFSFTPALTGALSSAMLDIARETMANTPPQMFCKAIVAGFMIAAMVWLLPNAEGAKFQVIILMTYLISAGGFVHIIAGSLEAFMLVLSGNMGLWDMLLRFIAPTLLGNIIGGTFLFALISYGQVAEEM